MEAQRRGMSASVALCLRCLILLQLLCCGSPDYRPGNLRVSVERNRNLEETKLYPPGFSHSSALSESRSP